MRLFTLIAGLAALPLSLSAEEIQGDYNNTLNTLYAVTQPGARAPEGDGFCASTFGSHIGSTISGSYSINTQTLMMSATATYMDAEVALYPLGIEGRYVFMSDGVPSSLSDAKVSRIILSMSEDQSDKESDVMFLGNDTYNCILSNVAPN